MAWTYQFDEIDKEVTKDPSTIGRFTFNRYLYFEPTEYQTWSKNQNYQPTSYTAELVGNSIIPSAGTHLSGSLSDFYLRDIVSITNIIEDEHMGHCSYAKVTLEYENKPPLSESSNESLNISFQPHDDQHDLPWEKNVDDLSVVSQEVTVPWISGYIGAATTPTLIATTAGQPFYGNTTSRWIQKITWSCCTDQNTDYSISAAVLNLEPITLISGLIEIPISHGLLMPPTVKRLYYNDEKRGIQNKPYYQWNFEIIRDSYGFQSYFLNAGTKAIIDGKLVDICSWYVYDPTSSSTPDKNFGSFAQMIQAKKAVDQYNKSVSEEIDKKVWSGDLVQSPVPLTIDGEIDTYAINHPESTLSLYWDKYKFDYWNILFR